MTISELIERLEALKVEHGDLPVRAFDICYGECEREEVEVSGVEVSKDGTYIEVGP